MENIWVVVAESGHARLFHRNKKYSPLEELEDRVHPESRLHVKDLVNDRQGRTFNRHNPGRHAKEEPTNPKRYEANEFAHEIAEVLETGRNHGDYDNLILVADPSFLGLLRSAMSKETQSKVVKEIHKNIVRKRPEEIQATIDAEV